MSSDADIRWIVAVIDRPRLQLPQAATFWATVSGTVTQKPKYDRFIELRRDQTDDWLLVQGVLDGPGSAHLDFSVNDPDRFTQRALSAGATVIAEHDSWLVLTSPSGLPFCVAAWKGEYRCPAPVQRPGGEISRVDQVCLDLPPSAYGTEATFWPALTGWPLGTRGTPGRSQLRSPSSIPIRVHLQRLSEERPTSFHLGIVTSAIAAVKAWHESLGATFASVTPHGTVLLDPTGTPYCLTEGNASTH
jgi:hypothetical protein